MADLLKDFESYFIEQDLLDPYVCCLDGAKEDPNAIIVVSEYGGSSSPTQIDGASRSIQILVRNTADNVEGAKAKVNELFQSLRTEDAIVQLTTLRWGVVTLRQPPFRMRVDAKGRVYYGFNVGIITYHD
jgi:hypothetical protein